MKRTMLAKAVAVLGLAAVAALAVSTLTAPVAVAACPPVACPEIAKICPKGQIACHPSPCSCALACVPDQGHGCDF